MTLLASTASITIHDSYESRMTDEQGRQCDEDRQVRVWESGSSTEIPLEYSSSVFIIYDLDNICFHLHP